MEKEYLKVKASFLPTGDIYPLAFEWPDGRVFDIDKILDIRPAASRKMGGFGTRYLCKVMDREVVLFLDDNRWFCEL